MLRTWKLDEKILDDLRREEWVILERALNLLGEAADLLLLRYGVHQSSLHPLAMHLQAISAEMGTSQHGRREGELGDVAKIP
jgi:hypothetical protein